MIAAFSVTPLGLTTDSVGDLVADAVRVVRDSGLPSETNAMFTNVEGEWDQVMGVIKAAVDVVAARAPRVSVVIKIDHRPGVDDAMHGKVESVERRLR
jgi:uncharacterized protein (TIGR00106 family)